MKLILEGLSNWNVTDCVDNSIIRGGNRMYLMSLFHMTIFSWDFTLQTVGWLLVNMLRCYSDMMQLLLRYDIVTSILWWLVKSAAPSAKLMITQYTSIWKTHKQKVKIFLYKSSCSAKKVKNYFSSWNLFKVGKIYEELIQLK